MTKNLSERWKAHLAMGSVAIFYGINYFTIKPVFAAEVNSFALLAVRCAIATAFFLIYHKIAVKEKITDRKDLMRLALAALFGVTLNQSMFLWGISLTSRVNASVLMITTPVFVFLMAWLLKQEGITLRKILGLALSFIGALSLILMGSKESLQLAGANITGDILITLNAACYGIYLVLVRPLFLKYHVVTIFKWAFLFGTIPNILLGIGPLLETDFSKLGPEALFGAFFLIVFATVLAYMLNAWAMQRVPSSAVGVYVYVQPVFVTLVSALLGFGEVSWLSIPFIFLIFAGVWMVTKKKS